MLFSDRIDNRSESLLMKNLGRGRHAVKGSIRMNEPLRSLMENTCNDWRRESGRIFDWNSGGLLVLSKWVWTLAWALQTVLCGSSIERGN